VENGGKLDNGQLAAKKSEPKFDYEIEWACKCYGLSSASVAFFFFGLKLGICKKKKIVPGFCFSRCV